MKTRKIKHSLYAHGDVNIESYKNLPRGELQKHEGKYTLAYGEHTNHSHVITVPSVDDMDVIKSADGGMYLVLRKEGVVTHEEHAPITIPAGTYRVDREREVDHFTKTTRRVLD
jgi:hypothetical protein